MMQHRKTATLLTVTALSACLLLAGCTEEKKPTPTETQNMETSLPETQQTETQPETTAPQYTADSLVTASQEETLKWTDGVGNDWNVTVSVPKIELSSEDAREIQTEIQRWMDPALAQIHQSQKQKTSAVYESLGWKAYLNGDVLSILVWQEMDADYTDYLVYNLDVKTGEELDSDDLAERLGMQETAYEQKALSRMDAAFTEKFGEAEQSDFYRQLREKNRSPENLDDACLFLNETGKPMLMFRLYSMAGAESYPTIIPFE